MFKKNRLKLKITSLYQKNLRSANFLAANWPQWKIARFFQEIQVRWRQIAGVVISKWAQVAF